MPVFQPSIYSYGQAETAPPGAGPVSASVTVSPTAETAKQAIPILGTIISSLWGRDEREDVEILKAKLENYRRQMKTAMDTPALPIVGYLPNTKGWYRNEINKLEGQLKASQELAGEERTSAQLYTAMKVGAVVAIFAGVFVVGGVAINQLQKARRTQAEIERLRMGGAT